MGRNPQVQLVRPSYESEGRDNVAAPELFLHQKTWRQSNAEATSGGLDQEIEMFILFVDGQIEIGPADRQEPFTPSSRSGCRAEDARTRKIFRCMQVEPRRVVGVADRADILVQQWSKDHISRRLEHGGPNG